MQINRDNLYFTIQIIFEIGIFKFDFGHTCLLYCHQMCRQRRNVKSAFEQFKITAVKVHLAIIISVRLWNYEDGGTYKARFLAKNQYTQRKSLCFETTGSASLSNFGHDFRK